MSATSPAAAVGRPTWLTTSPYCHRSSRPADIMVIRQPSHATVGPLSFQDVGPISSQSPYISPVSMRKSTPWTPHTPGTPGTRATVITHHTTLTVQDSDDDTGCCLFIPGSATSRRRREKKRRSLADLCTPRSPEGIPYKYHDPKLTQRIPRHVPDSQWSSTGESNGSPDSVAEFPGGISGFPGGQRSRAVSLVGYPSGKGVPLSATGHPRDGPAPVVARPRQSRVMKPPTTMVNDDELW